MFKCYIITLNCLTLIYVPDKFLNNKLHFTYLLPFSMAYLYMDSIWSQTRLKSKWQSRLCHWSQWPITSSFRNCELITKNLAWVSDSIWSIWSANCSYLWNKQGIPRSCFTILEQCYQACVVWNIKSLNPALPYTFGQSRLPYSLFSYCTWKVFKQVRRAFKGA